MVKQHNWLITVLYHQTGVIATLYLASCVGSFLVFHPQLLSHGWEPRTRGTRCSSTSYAHLYLARVATA